MSDGSKSNLKDKLQLAADTFHYSRKSKFIDRILITLNKVAENGEYHLDIYLNDVGGSLSLKATTKDYSEIKEYFISEGLTITNDKAENLNFRISWGKFQIK